MDSYKKLINYIYNELKKLQPEMEVNKEKLNKKEAEIRELNSQYNAAKEEHTTKTEHLFIVKNFKEAVKEKRIWFIAQTIIRGIVVGAVVGVAYLLLNSLVTPALWGIIVALLEAGVLGFSYVEYRDDTEEERLIKKRYNLEFLENYVEELKNNKISLGNKLMVANKEKETIQDTIDALTEKENELIDQMNSINAKREKVIANIVLVNESKLDSAFRKDREVVKLERKLKDGENI